MSEENNLNLPADYAIWLTNLKGHIATARRDAIFSLNTTVMTIYWEIGCRIVEKEKDAAWGSGLIDRLARDLSDEFPEIRGFSRRNLYAMRQWHLFYSPHSQCVPQAVAQIPWGHNRLIISKIKDINEALWYATATIGNGWARDILELKIEKMNIREWVNPSLIFMPHCHENNQHLHWKQ